MKIDRIEEGLVWLALGWFALKIGLGIAVAFLFVLSTNTFVQSLKSEGHYNRVHRDTIPFFIDPSQD